MHDGPCRRCAGARGATAGAAVALLGAAGYAASAGLVFALGLAAFAVHLAWQIARLDIGDPDNCLAVFKSDRDAGLILFAGLLLDAALRI
jgi:4-hydroxybenzoate polyprenyltransferase